MSLRVHVLRNVPMLQCNRVALYVFSQPLHTGYADHGIPLKGRPPQSSDELQVCRALCTFSWHALRQAVDSVTNFSPSHLVPLDHL